MHICMYNNQSKEVKVEEAGEQRTPNHTSKLINCDWGQINIWSTYAMYVNNVLL